MFRKSDKEGNQTIKSDQMNIEKSKINRQKSYKWTMNKGQRVPGHLYQL